MKFAPGRLRWDQVGFFRWAARDLARWAASSTMLVATADTLMWLFRLRVRIRFMAASGVPPERLMMMPTAWSITARVVSVAWRFATRGPRTGSRPGGDVTAINQSDGSDERFVATSEFSIAGVFLGPVSCSSLPDAVEAERRQPGPLV